MLLRLLHFKLFSKPYVQNVTLLYFILQNIERIIQELKKKLNYEYDRNIIKNYFYL